MASIFNAARTLDESWSVAPRGRALQQELEDLGIYDEGLSEEGL